MNRETEGERVAVLERRQMTAGMIRGFYFPSRTQSVFEGEESLGGRLHALAFISIPVLKTYPSGAERSS